MDEDPTRYTVTVAIEVDAPDPVTAAKTFIDVINDSCFIASVDDTDVSMRFWIDTEDFAVMRSEKL